MVTPIETTMLSSLIDIFGGSPLLLGMFGLVCLVVLIALAKVPKIVVLPIGLIGFMLLGNLIPELALLVAIGMGLLIFVLVLKLMRGDM